MNIRKITKNHYQAVDEKTGLKATILMNPRDAMVIATIDELPTDAKQQETAIADFETYLKTQVGGKILLRLPPSAPAAVTQEKADVKFISSENIQKAFSAFVEREKVKKIYEAFADESSSLLLLDEEHHYVGRFDTLFQFKAKYGADFVTLAKIDQGLYSGFAEREKIQNEFVRHFAFYDNKKNMFIGCLQLFMHGDMAYISDLIVAEEYRRQGYAEALLTEAFNFMMLHGLKHMWLIEGKPGSKEIGEALHHIYDVLLGAKGMMSELQASLGLRLMFGAPKQLLLEASNRSIHPPHLTQDGKPKEVTTLKSMGVLPAPLLQTAEKTTQLAPQSLRQPMQ